MINCFKKAINCLLSFLSKTHKFIQEKVEHRYIIATCAVCVLTICFVFVENTVNAVCIQDNGNTVVAYTSFDDSEKILDVAGIELFENDIIDTSKLTDGKGEIIIKRAQPVNITADQKTTTIKIAEGNVSDALKMANISLDGDDCVNLDLNTPIKPNMEIVVGRVSYKERIETENISFDTVTKETYTLGRGKSSVISAGVEGQKQLVYKDKYIDGTVVGSEFVSEKVVKNPSAQVVSAGLSPKTPCSLIEPPAGFALDANGKPAQYKSVIKNAISVAYSARPGAYTASGRRAMQGFVAVDPKVIPYGTKLYITSEDNQHIYGYAIAADTGTALREKIVDVDLFFNSYEASCRWGKKKVNIYILP